MEASTNLVFELGVVAYLLLGWRFLGAQFVGGTIMIIAPAGLVGLFFSKSPKSNCARGPGRLTRRLDEMTYYFCGEGCRAAFLNDPGPAPSQQSIQLGRKPRHE